MLVCEIYESSLSFLSHALKKIGEAGNEAIIGASLSEPHIDELNVRNLYIIIMVLRHPRTTVEIVQVYVIYSNTT